MRSSWMARGWRWCTSGSIGLSPLHLPLFFGIKFFINHSFEVMGLIHISKIESNNMVISFKGMEMRFHRMVFKLVVNLLLPYHNFL